MTLPARRLPSHPPTPRAASSLPPLTCPGEPAGASELASATANTHPLSLLHASPWTACRRSSATTSSPTTQVYTAGNPSSPSPRSPRSPPSRGRGATASSREPSTRSPSPRQTSTSSPASSSARAGLTSPASSSASPCPRINHARKATGPQTMPPLRNPSRGSSACWARGAPTASWTSELAFLCPSDKHSFDQRGGAESRPVRALRTPHPGRVAARGGALRHGPRSEDARAAELGSRRRPRPRAPAPERAEGALRDVRTWDIPRPCARGSPPR